MPAPRKNPNDPKWAIIDAQRSQGVAGAPAAPVDGVRQQIKSMTGHATEEEMAASLPTSTMVSEPVEEVRTRKPRQPRAAVETDPLMTDPKYKKAVEGMRAFGGKKIVEKGFAISGKPLNAEEKEGFDDYFYVVSKKANFDPSSSWVFMFMYLFVLLGEAIVSRVIAQKGEDLWQKVAKFLGFDKDEEEKKEPEADEREND